MISLGAQLQSFLDSRETAEPYQGTAQPKTSLVARATSPALSQAIVLGR